MALFSNKSKSNQALPYVDGLYPAEDLGSPLVSNTTYEYDGVRGVQYVQSNGTLMLTGGTIKGDTPAKSKTSANTQSPITDNALLIDIAQSHHYTVHIDGMGLPDFKKAGSPMTKYGFLPVKTMNVRFTSYENMSIPVAIFGDFPLLNRKRVGTIDITCYDKDSNQLEAQLRQWEASCFPRGRYVAYMDEIARKFTYRGYNVKGQKTLTYQVFVIPTGNVSVSRDYSANEAKMLSFSLVVVGDGKTCATGNGDIPIVDHGGGGDGSGGTYYTLYANDVSSNGKSLIK